MQKTYKLKKLLPYPGLYKAWRAVPALRETPLARSLLFCS